MVKWVVLSGFVPSMVSAVAGTLLMASWLDASFAFPVAFFYGMVCGSVGMIVAVGAAENDWLV